VRNGQGGQVVASSLDCLLGSGMQHVCTCRGKTVPCVGGEVVDFGGAVGPFLCQFREHTWKCVDPAMQEYGLRKRIEHFVKCTVSDGAAISVVDPKAYCMRFRKQMRDLFVTAPPK
jgi:Phosphatidylinositol-4-phosphate 5-Kinase